jgi:hypothetical protein
MQAERERLDFPSPKLRKPYANIPRDCLQNPEEGSLCDCRAYLVTPTRKGSIPVKVWHSFALVTVALAGCASPAASNRQTACYVVEDRQTEPGFRALREVPCPPGRSGVLIEQET